MKSMRFYVQKDNNAISILKKEEVEEEKLNQKQMKTKMPAQKYTLHPGVFKPDEGPTTQDRP